MSGLGPIVAAAVFLGVGLPVPQPGDVVDLRGLGWRSGKLDPEKAALRGLDAETIELPRQTVRTAPDQRAYEFIPSQRRIEGWVVLECRLETTGRAEDCTVARPLFPLLDEAALETVRAWRYTPLKLRGEERAALLHIGVEFRREQKNRLAPPSPTTR
jgi:TonB family protein